MRSEICRSLSIAILMTLLFIDPVCLAESAQTLIIYPKVKAPVQRIYTTIIEGIQQTLPHSDSLLLDQSTTPVQLANTLRQMKPEKIIALGRTMAEKVIESGYREHMSVAAAVFDPLEFPSGVSLAIDSRSLLKKIHSLLPWVNRVFVLDTSTHPSIKVYPESLHDQPLMIIQYYDDPLLATRQLGQLLDGEASKNDAIILPSHLDRDILYEMAQLAWEKKIILLSTNLTHLKDGILMVFYPDNAGMGRQIGAFMTEQQGQGYASLTHLHVALNPTVAEHLGFEFTPAVLNQFQLKVK